MARPKKTAQTAEATRETILAYKGFNANFACTPDGKVYQYEVGKTYRHEGEVKACGAGFHACEYPLDVLRYYGPADSRFAVVELAGQTAREKDGDSKIAAAEITIKAEIRLPELIQAAIRYVMDRVTLIDGNYASGKHEAVKSTKTNGAATASGNGGAATASGDRGAATASGDWGAATATGNEGKVRGADGCALFLVERGDAGDILHSWAGIVGRDGIKSMTWYRLEDGKPVEVDEVAD